MEQSPSPCRGLERKQKNRMGDEMPMPFKGMPPASHFLLLGLYPNSSTTSQSPQQLGALLRAQIQDIPYLFLIKYSSQCVTWGCKMAVHLALKTMFCAPVGRLVHFRKGQPLPLNMLLLLVLSQGLLPTLWPRFSRPTFHGYTK